MFAMASSRLLKNTVPRTDTSPYDPSTPTSTPVRTSGSSSGFGLVTTLPARKPRWSSLSVGVRLPVYTAPLTAYRPARHATEARGLKKLSDLVGRVASIGSDFHQSPRPPSSNVNASFAAIVARA